MTRLLARFITWAQKPAWTNGEAAMFCLAWVAAGGLSLIFGWRLWVAAPVVVAITCIAAFGQGFVRGFIRAMHRDLRNGNQS